ncbi:MAG TPA: hypothetical protein VLJ86_07720 [Ramlibacter sp.]|nr:hypothetical protein [Ramlibacter sp.]
MARWTPFPFSGEYRFDAPSLSRAWPTLHAGDAEALPRNPAVLQAWVLFHQGDFEAAWQAGLDAGPAGVTVANKACAVYATHLEPREKTRLELYQQVAARAEAQALADATNPNAWYWYAYALGRYSQCVSVARALAQGLGIKVKDALERTVALEPRHADAHIALGTFHAEVIDKVGELIGAMTYRASKEKGMLMLREGLRLNPGSAIAMIECANSMLMLMGEAAAVEASRLYERAAACDAVDALERLNIERARLELQD